MGSTTRFGKLMHWFILNVMGRNADGSGYISVEGNSIYRKPGIVHISFTNVEAEEVLLAIYTAEGKEVNTLFTGIAEAYTNYTLRFDGSYLPNGVYYAVLRRAGGATEQLPIMVVK